MVLIGARPSPTFASGSIRWAVGNQSFRATSGPVIRSSSRNVEAMIAIDTASPPKTVAQHEIPGMLNARPT